MTNKLLYILSAMLLVTSCGTTKQTRASQYPKMYENQPLTLLVMPPINNTTNVEAKEYLYTSISKPLAEAGYYVISPRLALDILKMESAYDAEQFTDVPLDKFRKFFGVDAVIFSEINKWRKVGFGIQTEIHYFIRSSRTGEVIFDRNCNLYLDTSSDVAKNDTILGALVNLTVSAIETATTDHIVAARRANYYIFRDIPYGKYHPGYQTDSDTPADDANISITVR